MPVIYIENKSTLPKRRDKDFYPTPVGFARSALAQLPADFVPTRVLDPGAGTGVWGRVAKGRWPDCRVTGIELRDVHCPPAYSFWSANTDYLTHTLPPVEYDLIAGNPPFRVAEAFVRKSLGLLSEGGLCYFLLPLNFLTSEKRKEGLFSEAPPMRVIISSRRISFTDDNNPDTHAMYLWQRGWQGETTLGWMLHEDNTAEEALPTAWQQLDFFAQL